MFRVSTQAFRRSESGVSAVEFAIIVPVLMTIVMGVLEFGMILYTFNSSENAARDVARRLATNRLTTAQASDTAKAELPGWASPSATVTVAQSAPTDPSQNQFTVSIAIPAKSATASNFLVGLYGSVTLNSKVVLQQEIAP